MFFGGVRGDIPELSRCPVLSVNSPNCPVFRRAMIRRADFVVVIVTWWAELIESGVARSIDEIGIIDCTRFA